MVTKLIFSPKYFGFFKKWTKKMSKIENPKYFLDKFFVNNIINPLKGLKTLRAQIWEHTITVWKIKLQFIKSAANSIK
jgi:hypothetical protein